MPHHIVKYYLVFDLFKGGGDQQLGLIIYKPSTYPPTHFPLQVACNVEDLGIPILVVLDCDLQSSLHEKTPELWLIRNHLTKVEYLKGTYSKHTKMWHLCDLNTKPTTCAYGGKSYANKSCPH